MVQWGKHCCWNIFICSVCHQNTRDLVAETDIYSHRPGGCEVKIKVLLISSIVRTLFLNCRWLRSHCLTWCRERASSLVSFLLRPHHDSPLLRWISLNLIIYKGSISKCHLTGLGLYHMKSGETQIQFIAHGNDPDVGDDTARFTSAPHRIWIHTFTTTGKGIWHVCTYYLLPLSKREFFWHFLLLITFIFQAWAEHTNWRHLSYSKCPWPSCKAGWEK